MRYWTHYWASTTPNIVDELSGPLDHTAGNRFRSRNVAVGDTVFVINFIGGHLRVIGRMVVDSIVDQSSATRALSYDPWDATEHAMARDGSSSTMRYDRFLGADEVDQVEFRTPAGTTGVARTKSGKPDQQTFRGLREVTAATAKLFERILKAKP